MIEYTHWTIEYKDHSGSWSEVTSLTASSRDDLKTKDTVDIYARQASAYYRYVRIVKQVGDDKYGTKEYI